MSSTLDDIVKNLRDLINSKKDILHNPLNIVAIGMEAMNAYKNLSGTEKKALLVRALTIIANGADGIPGTSDDVISPHLLNTIRTVIEGNMLDNMINIIADASKGRFDIGKGVAIAKETCYGCFPLKSKKYIKG